MPVARTLTRDCAFACLWLLVIGVSVQDGYLVLASRWVITSFERNPVGRLLLHWNGGDIWLLLIAKIMGTVCAASLLLVLYWTWPRLGWIVCTVTASVQLVLLLFLYLA